MTATRSYTAAHAPTEPPMPAALPPSTASTTASTPPTQLPQELIDEILMTCLHDSLSDHLDCTWKRSHRVHCMRWILNLSLINKCNYALVKDACARHSTSAYDLQLQLDDDRYTGACPAHRCGCRDLGEHYEKESRAAWVIACVRRVRLPVIDGLPSVRFAGVETRGGSVSGDDGESDSERSMISGSDTEEESGSESWDRGRN